MSDGGRIVHDVHIRATANGALASIGEVIAEALRKGGFETDGVVCSGAIVYAHLGEDEPEEPRAEDYAEDCEDGNADHEEAVREFDRAKSQECLLGQFNAIDSASPVRLDADGGAR